MDIGATVATAIIGLREPGVFPHVEPTYGYRDDGNRTEADTTTAEAAGVKSGKEARSHSEGLGFSLFSGAVAPLLA
jgi:hypothetical protein